MAQHTISSLKWRYATKRFDAKKKLGADKIEVLKEAFNLTATSYGLQPLKLLVISDAKIKEQLVPISMNQLQVKDASHVLVFCIENDLSQEYIKSYFNTVSQVRKTPKEVLEPFESHVLEQFSKKQKDEISSWMTKQAYLAMGNLLTVCALEEIDSCPMEGFEPDKYDALLGLADLGLKSVLVMPVGYRSKDDMFSSMKKVRRGTDKVVIEM